MTIEKLDEHLGDGNAENEENLVDLFIATEDYEKVKLNRRQIVIGERGTGKSAIFRMLDATHDDKVWIISLTPDSTSWVRLQEVAKICRGDIAAIARQWEFAILLECFETALSQLPSTVRRRKVIKELDAEIKKSTDRSLLETTSTRRFSVIVATALEILQKIPFTIELKAPGIPVSIKQREAEQGTAVETKFIPQYQDLLIERMYHVLKSIIPPENSIRILIDQLDDHWQGRKNQIESLCGLFTAAMQVRENITRAGLKKRVNVTLFIRSDIYENLKRNGLDHVSKYTSYELYLRWDAPYLENMISRRIASAKSKGVRKLADLFTTENIERKSLDKYILAKTFPRPRDVIRFISFCLERAEQTGHRKITREDVLAAEIHYSNWRLDVIREEVRYEYDYAEHLLESFIGTYVDFPLRELRRHLDEFKNDNQILTSDRESTKPALMKKLIRWGVLGIRQSKKTVFIWDSTVRGYLSPSGNDVVVLHPALWKGLNLKRRRTKRRT